MSERMNTSIHANGLFLNVWEPLSTLPIHAPMHYIMMQWMCYSIGPDQVTWVAPFRLSKLTKRDSHLCGCSLSFNLTVRVVLVDFQLLRFWRPVLTKHGEGMTAKGNFSASWKLPYGYRDRLEWMCLCYRILGYVPIVTDLVELHRQRATLVMQVEQTMSGI